MEQDARIAIIGISCRFPSADGPAAFWKLLEQGIDAITEAPEDRPEFAQLFDPDPKTPGRTYARWGGFLKDIDQFDAPFFNISPREASHMDPQHRLLLEMAWEAAEDAGVPLSSLAGTRTGVFMGVATHDYGDLQMYPQNRNHIGKHTNSGMAQSIAANRISYLWDLRGPSLVMDTACSSALTAVHAACQSLLLGESTMALAGGAQATLTPSVTIGFSKAAMLSRDGRCKAFDADANGYVRSEGVGMVLLKPLAAALADGDPIQAVIRATAVNQDGRTISMTVPSAQAQQSLIEEALEKAGLQPEDVQYVEAHGTGTPVGDPIEAAAIGGALGATRSPDQALPIGSVKTNIGHLEAASGIAGLIKVVLALKHRMIPPSLHFRKPHRRLDLDALRLRVVTELEPWPHPDKPLIAGVNSFGFGGANAHVLLEAAPELPSATTPEETLPRLLVLSAKSKESLAKLANAYADCFRDERNTLRDICHTTAERRSHLEHRVAIVATERDEFLSRLSDYASGSSNANIAHGRMKRSGAPPVAFVFSGMGPQWWSMGRQLKESVPVFRRALENCDALLRPYSGWSLMDEFARDEASSRVAAPELAQVTNFALQIALTELWASYGIVPSAVVGHSGGAIAAAHVAGVYELKDALRLAFHRSRLQGRPANQGKMLSVGVPYDEIAPLLEAEGDRVSLAAVNGPTAITLSGHADSIERLAQQCSDRHIFARILAVNIAYHSPVMEQIREEFLTEVKDLRGRAASIPFVSDVTGTWASGEECDAQYWWRAIRQPVLFRDAIRTLLDRELQTFVEIGPHPVLSSSVLECMKEAGIKGTAIPSLRRSESERLTLLRSLGSLYALGCDPKWRAMREPLARLLDLPTYPWNRTRHWFEASETTGGWQDSGPPEHPLLGSRLPTARPEWESRAGDGPTAFLKDHKVQNAVIFPGAGYVEMALASRRLAFRDARVTLREVEFLRPLVLSLEGETALQFATSPEKGSYEVFSSATAKPGSWIVHSRGLAGGAPPASSEALDVQALRERVAIQRDRDAFYEGLAARGLFLGPAFQGIRSLWTGEGEALGLIESPQVTSVDGYQIHPALLDAGFQVLVAAVDSDPSLNLQIRLFLPVKISEIRFLSEPGTRFLSHARVVEVKDASITGDVQLFREDGTPCVEIRGLTARMADSNAGARAESVEDWLYDYRWEALPLEQRVAHVQFPEDVDALRANAEATSLELGWRDYYATVEGQLGEIGAAYAYTAVTQAGQGKALSPTALAGTGWRRSLAQQLFENLELAGFLRRQGDGWETTGIAPKSSAAALGERLLQNYPQYALEVGLLERCGPRIAEVLVGKAEGTEVLFGADGFQSLERFYTDSPAQAFYNRVVTQVVDACKGESLRVLEVGGGTAGTTAHLLPRLGGICSSYVFTDVSPLFLERAKERFADYEHFSTRIFDLSRDATAKGLEPGSFDLILAANVLHATKDVAASVNRLRPLLAPGGILVLLEITRHPRWVDTVFGLTEGWWKFEDSQRRPKYPLLSGRAWVDLLGETGWEHPTVIADAAPGEPAQSVVIARRPLRDAQPSAQKWVALADARGVADRTAAALIARGHECEVVPASGDLAALVADPERWAAGVLYFGSIEAPRLDNTTPLDPGVILGSASGCNAALAAIQQLFQKTPLAERKLVLVTAGAQAIGGEAPELLQAPLWGLGRAVCKEWPNVRCQMIDLSAAPTDAEITDLVKEVLYENTPEAPLEEEIALRAGVRLVHRLRRTTLAAIESLEPAVIAAPEDHWRAELSTAGSFEDVVLRLHEAPVLQPDQVEVAISQAGLNFREVMLSLGVVPGIELEGSFGGGRLGADFFGVITRCGDAVTHLNPGDKVVGIGPGTFASHVVTPSALVARCPENLSGQQAASIPAAYITAHYALRHLARLSRGESVLIHAATGGVGLAAIQMAQDVGAGIFATAGSPAKRAYLESIGVVDVMDSRSTEFADQVLRSTGGRGVDVILNSLAGPAIGKGISILASYGRFVEIGKADIYQNHSIEIGPFRRNLSFFAVDLDRLCYERPGFTGEMLHDVLEELRLGLLNPPPITEFQMTELASAMRFMAQAKHIGKIVLTNHAGTEVRRAIPEHTPVGADGTYLITGGLGGVGLLVARWLLTEGARSIVLMGRNAPSPETEALLDEMREGGARIEAVSGDVSIFGDVQRAVRFIRDTLPPLRGVIHGAMVLEDTSLEALTPESMERVMKPKVAGAWNLHLATLRDPLEFFICFSSIAALLGNAQQGNYAAANCFMDALGPFRRAHGLPATTINWGVISGSGYVARHREVLDFLDRQGYLSLNEEQVLKALQVLLRYAPPQMMAARIDWTKLAEQWPRIAASPRIRHLPSTNKGGPVQAEGGADNSILRQLQAADAGQRVSLMETYLRDRVARLLGASSASMDTDRPISDMGLDSLIAVELTAILERDLRVETLNTGLLGATIRGLGEDLLKQLALESRDAQSTPAAASSREPDPEMAQDAEEDEEELAEKTSAVLMDAALESHRRTAPSPVSANGAAGAGAASGAGAAVNGQRRVHAVGQNLQRDSAHNGAHESAHGGGTDYSALNYSSWSPTQQAIRVAVRAGFGALGHVKVDGLENIPREGGCLLAVNHLSMADVPLLLTQLPRRAIILANERLKQYGIIDWFISDMGQAIYVTRNQADSESLGNALTVLRNGGVIALAPEGTRSRTGALLRGKTGVAWLATQTGVPVVPMAAWGQEKWRDRWKRFHRIPIHVRAGTPLRFPSGPASPADLRQYTDHIMTSIAALLPEQYRGVYHEPILEQTVTTKDS